MEFSVLGAGQKVQLQSPATNNTRQFAILGFLWLDAGRGLWYGALLLLLLLYKSGITSSS